MEGWENVLRRCVAVFIDSWRKRKEIRQVDRKRSEAKFLPAELEILDSPPWPLARVILWMIMALFVIAIIWSYFGHLDIVASARGSIIPDSRTKVIQSVVEGRVASINVADGEQIQAGEVLIELDTVSAQAAYSKSISELHTALLQSSMARLLVTVDFQDAVKTEPPQLAHLSELLIIPMEQIASQQSILDGLFWMQRARNNQFLAQRKTQEAAQQVQTEQAEATRKLIVRDEAVLVSQLTGLDKQLEKLNKEFPLAQKQLESIRILRAKEIISIGALHAEETKMLRLEARREEFLNRKNRLLAEGARSTEQRSKELRQYTSMAAEIKARIAQLQTDANLVISEFRSRMAELAANQSRAANSLNQEIVQIQQLLDNHKVIAPEAGVVEQLAIHAVGAVVQPSQSLMTIVPKDAQLVAEVEILNKDVGFVTEGQQVRVKVDSFPYTKYGLIIGEVIDIADDAVEREGIGLVFRTRVRLLQDSISVEGKQVRMRPGMSITAEIGTGERRVIDFFLDPFLRTQDESLTVR